MSLYFAFFWWFTFTARRHRSWGEEEDEGSVCCLSLPLSLIQLVLGQLPRCICNNRIKVTIRTNIVAHWFPGHGGILQKRNCWQFWQNSSHFASPPLPSSFTFSLFLSHFIRSSDEWNIFSPRITEYLCVLASTVSNIPGSRIVALLIPVKFFSADSAAAASRFILLFAPHWVFVELLHAFIFSARNHSSFYIFMRTFLSTTNHFSIFYYFRLSNL